jgi:hypothetical protein
MLSTSDVPAVGAAMTSLAVVTEGITTALSVLLTFILLNAGVFNF